MFSSKGRLNRKRYWLAILNFCIASAFLLAFINGLADLLGSENAASPLIVSLRAGAMLVTWWVGFALGGRRLHDRNISAWFLLPSAIPIFGWIWFIYQAVQPGTVGENRFGPDPLAGPVPTAQTDIAAPLASQPLPNRNSPFSDRLAKGNLNTQSVIIVALVAILFAGAGAWLYETYGSGLINSVSNILPLSDHLAWDVGYPKNQPNPQLEADATHDIDGGGKIDIAATCDSDSDASNITITFNYYSKYDKGDGNDSPYGTQGLGSFAHVPVVYSIDGGETQQANSQTDYENSARVVFSFISPNAKIDPISGGPIILAKLFGALQDLQPFLHAHEIDFKLPLGGDNWETVKLYPQDSAFQDFISQCKIDARRIDDEVAKQKSDANAMQQQSQSQQQSQTSSAPEPAEPGTPAQSSENQSAPQQTDSHPTQQQDQVTPPPDAPPASEDQVTSQWGTSPKP